MLKQTILQCVGPVIMPEFLPEEIRADHPRDEETAADGSAVSADFKQFIDARLAAQSRDLYAEAKQMMERYLLTSVLRSTDGNQSRAAEILGITRGSLRSKIRALGISIHSVLKVEEPDRDRQEVLG